MCDDVSVLGVAVAFEWQTLCHPTSGPHRRCPLSQAHVHGRDCGGGMIAASWANADADMPRSPAIELIGPSGFIESTAHGDRSQRTRRTEVILAGRHFASGLPPDRLGTG